jgi:hypothetical protein
MAAAQNTNKTKNMAAIHNLDIQTQFIFFIFYYKRERETEREREREFSNIQNIYFI